MSGDEQQAEGATTELRQLVERAFAEAPALYANGFVNGLGIADAYLVLQANGRPVAVVNMPLSLAKTLGESLLEMVQSHEQHTGQRVRTMQELDDV